MPRKGSAHQPLTAARKRKYIEAIRETANYTEAARIASPHSKGPRGAVSTFNIARGRDPEFDEECVAAMNEAVNRLASKVYERARDGVVTERRTLPDGTVLERVAYDVKRELAVLGKLDDDWVPKRYSETFNTNHTKIDANVALPEQRTMKLVASLDRDERDALRGLLEKARALDAGEPLLTIEAEVAKPKPDPIREAIEEAAPPVARLVPRTRNDDR